MSAGTATGFLEALGPANEALGAMARNIEAIGSSSAKAAEQSKSAFEQIGEIAHAQIANIAAGAFNAYADAIDDALATGEFSAKSFGAALRNMLAQTLRAIGQEATIRGAFEVAAGIAALPTPKAAQHFISAGQFFAVALAAGVGAGALSTGGGSGQGATPRGIEAGASGGGGGGGGASEDVTIIGTLDVRQAESLHDQLGQSKRRRDLSSAS